MRTQLLSSLLILSFVLGSFPVAQAQEVPEPSPEPVAEPVAEPEPELTLEPIEVPVEPAPIADPIEAPAEPEPAVEEIPVLTAAPEVLVVEEPPSVTLTVRYGENVAWTGNVPLPEGGTVSATPTGESTGIDIAANSLLALLLSVDAESDSFAITDLDYFPSFGSFLVNCISATSFANACGEWQYVIDGTYPFVGIDDYILNDDDEVFIYFGSPRRTILGDTSITVNETFTATAQSYDPETNAYNPLPGYTIGITQPDPTNPWSPIEIATSTSASDGTATFTLTTEGTYGIGLKEDFYFPSYSFTVSSSTDDGSGESGPGSTESFDFTAAYNFLKEGQNHDGSWDSPLATDWGAIALAAPGAPAGMKASLTSYLREEDESVSSVIDHERHAMALMALGINPYTGGPDDYVTPIVDSFDGTQIDKPDEVNDDIFGLIVLLHAGYDRDDEMIKDIVAFIVKSQQDSGAWKGSVDMTGAAMQALSEVRSLPGVSSALSKSEAFLRDQQDSDGGFGDPSSTSWALMGIEAVGGSPASWSINGNTPLTYLAQAQNEDGGMDVPFDSSYDNRAWVTTYAIPAAKGVTWADVLKDFKKPATDSKDDEDEEEDTATTTGEVLGVTRAEEPLIEPYVAVSMDIPAETPVATELADTPELAVADDVAEELETTEPPSASDLTAAASESGIWGTIKGFFSSFWSFLKNLFS